MEYRTSQNLWRYQNSPIMSTDLNHWKNANNVEIFLYIFSLTVIGNTLILKIFPPHIEQQCLKRMIYCQKDTCKDWPNKVNKL